MLYYTNSSTCFKEHRQGWDKAWCGLHTVLERYCLILASSTFRDFPLCPALYLAMLTISHSHPLPASSSLSSSTWRCSWPFSPAVFSFPQDLQLLVGKCKSRKVTLGWQKLRQMPKNVGASKCATSPLFFIKVHKITINNIWQNSAWSFRQNSNIVFNLPRSQVHFTTIVIFMK